LGERLESLQERVGSLQNLTANRGWRPVEGPEVVEKGGKERDWIGDG
jgi:hypothetical protein